MTGVLKIQVVTLGDDGNMAAVTDAEVVLGRRDLLQGSKWPHDDLLPTHQHTADGYYGVWVGPGAEPTPGEWLLVVRNPASSSVLFSPVVQRLTLKDTAGVLQALPGWGRISDRLGAQAATVSISNAGGRNSAEAPDHTTINVRLFKRTEIFGITGHDEGGTSFAEFAKGRRNLLRKWDVVDDGVISILFDEKSHRILVSVKSARAAASSWVSVAEDDMPADHVLSMTDFYNHLHVAGRDHPGTIIEAGVFGHSWLMGPIIMNTIDNTSSVTERADEDTDGRQKDWLPPGEPSQTPTGPVTDGPTMTYYSSIRDAFHPDRGALRIWGCNHMQNVVAQCQAANAERRRGSARDRFFFVPLQTITGRNFYSGGEQNTTQDYVKRSVGMLIQSRYYAQAIEPCDFRGAVIYAGAAARYLRLPVYAGPPGLGSLLGNVEGQPTFFIHSGKPERPGPSDTTRSDPPVVYRREASHPGTESGPVLQWFRDEYPSLALDDLRYANFTAMIGEPLPDPGFHTERFEMFYDEGQRDQLAGSMAAVVLRLPTGLEVHTPVEHATQPNTVYSRPIPDVLSGVQGHRYVIRGRTIAQVQHRGPATVVMMIGTPARDRDSAIFVGVDGRSIWLESPARANQFAVRTAPIEQGDATFYRRSAWTPPASASPVPITDGVIETATPRCYW